MNTQFLSLLAQRTAPPFWEQPQFIVTALMVGGAIFVITLFLVTVARFYRRCGADEALVRTGAGGNKVIIGGGVTVFPILHQLLRVSLRSLKLSVDRSGHMALVTRDKIRANVTTELYIKVEPLADDVMAAAQKRGLSPLSAAPTATRGGREATSSAPSATTCASWLSRSQCEEESSWQWICF